MHFFKGTIVALIIMCSAQVYAQFGYGASLRTDLYQRYANPTDDIEARSAGSAIINIGVLPKIWLGGEKFSISGEGGINFSPFALSVSDFKGMGALSFPVMAKLNLGGLSNLNREGKFGFTIGGGLQWSKTEIFGLQNDAEENGVVRNRFKTYITEAGYGFGMSGFSLYGYVRYGWSNDTDANTFNFGVAYDFNIPTLKELTNPDF